MARGFPKRIADIARWPWRHHSIMVLSGAGSRVRHFSIPGFLVILSVIVGVTGLAGGGAWVLGWSSARIEREHVDDLRTENMRLQGQIQDIRQVVEVFESRLEENSSLEQEVRNLANLDAIPEDVRRLGVGGPQPLSELADEASPSVLVREARETLNRLDELNRRAHFQNANFQEVVSALQQSKEELEHLPSISPVSFGWTSSGYGTRKDPFTGRLTMHRGLDFSSWTGTPVYATADGKVRKAGKAGTLGLLVEIDHDNGVTTRYGHNSKLLVKVGQRVKRGDLIAEVGSTGRSTSPHCHYEIHVNGRHVNPWRYILDGGPSMKRGA